MRYYVNLPISWIYNDGEWAEFFARRGLNPELGFDELSLGLPLRWHKENASRLKDSGLLCAVHLPFFGPPLGQPDAQARRYGVDILKKAAEVAGIYEAGHLIGHPSFFAHTDANEAGVADGDIGPRPSERWLENSVQGWEEVLALSEARLYLENTHDIGPEAVLSLLNALARGDYNAQIGMCFDLGHWFSFAQGCDRYNLHDWLDKISPYLSHLHLHDNNGRSDQHWGLGRGNIPLHDFFTWLAAQALTPGFTLEPHDVEALECSLGWLANDACMQDWMRICSDK